MTQCPIHGELKISKKNGKPFCLAPDGTFCNAWRNQAQPMQSSGGWPQVRQQVAQKVAPEKASMTREDWEAKERRTNKNILLQVAFKAAVELVTAGKIDIEEIGNRTIVLHQWLLSQTEGQSKPISQNIAPSDDLPPLDLYQDDPEAHA